MNKRISDNKINIIDEALFSIKIEGTTPQNKTVNISKKLINNKISSEQAISEIIKLHNV